MPRFRAQKGYTAAVLLETFFLVEVDKTQNFIRLDLPPGASRAHVGTRPMLRIGSKVSWQVTLGPHMCM